MARIRIEKIVEEVYKLQTICSRKHDSSHEGFSLMFARSDSDEDFETYMQHEDNQKKMAKKIDEQKVLLYDLIDRYIRGGYY